jgi:hypothetical protein
MNWKKKANDRGWLLTRRKISTLNAGVEVKPPDAIHLFFTV